MIKEIKCEIVEAMILIFIIFWGLVFCDISNRESIWQEAYQNRVYTAPEAAWPKDVSGQPLGFGIKNLGLTQNSEYWVK